MKRYTLLPGIALAFLALPASGSAPSFQVEVVNKTAEPLEWAMGVQPGKKDWGKFDGATWSVAPGKRDTKSARRASCTDGAESHYVQLVWAETRYLGCGLVADTSFTQVQCDYACRGPGATSTSHFDAEKNLLTIEVRPAAD